MLKDMALVALGAVFGLGASMTAVSAPAYFPGVQMWIWHTLFWAGVAIMTLMVVDAVLIVLWSSSSEPKVFPALGINLGICLIGASLIYFYSPAIITGQLGLTAIFTDAEYAGGTVISGIHWKTEFTELKVHIRNGSSSYPYEDLDLLIRPSQPVAAIIQSTDVPNCFFQTKHALSTMQMAVLNGNKIGNPLVIVATDAGYRLHCSVLPKNITLSVLMALARIKPPTPEIPLSKSAAEHSLEKDFYLKFYLNDDSSSYWLAHADGDVYSLPRPDPEWVKVDGQYNVNGKTVMVSQQLQVSGKINIHSSGDR